MKKTIIPNSTPPTWAPNALYAKAICYVQHTNELDSDDWEYAFWPSLSLELLARAALANVSPALLPESDRSWSSLYHALGFTPTEERFSPKSIAISEVFRRLLAILPDFTKQHESFGVQRTGRRNAELHSGEAAFEGKKGSSWRPRLFETIEILLASMGGSLDDFVGEDQANLARQLIATAADESAKSIKGEVEAHRKVWLAKVSTDRDALVAQATLWASRHDGHRVECPACGSRTLAWIIHRQAADMA